MDSKRLIDRLERHASWIRATLEGLTAEEAAWKPAADKWSLLEVAGHLLDEEREDFRARLDLLLHHPGVLGPPIDPQGWVRERRYNERNLDATLQMFLEERTRSVQWLRGLPAPAWGNTLEHPSLGSIRAGDLLGAWVAHDLLHLRQLAHVHWLYVAHLAQPYATGYAGNW